MLLTGRVELTHRNPYSLLVKARELDIILAIDASADTEYYCELRSARFRVNVSED